MQRLRPLRRRVRRPLDRRVHPPAHVARQEKEKDAERGEQNCAQNDEDLFPHPSNPPAENVRQASSLSRAFLNRPLPEASTSWKLVGQRAMTSTVVPCYRGH